MAPRRGELFAIRALSDAQILAGYVLQNTAPTIANGKVASYSFSGNGVDASSFANHADLAGASLTTDRFGYGKSAVVANGATTEVSAPNSAQLNSDYTTISFWVKPNSFPASGEVFILSHGGWQERWKISLPTHGKPVLDDQHATGAILQRHGQRRRQYPYSG